MTETYQDEINADNGSYDDWAKQQEEMAANPPAEFCSECNHELIIRSEDDAICPILRTSLRCRRPRCR